MQKKAVIQIMDYAAPYRGNFISAIERIEQELIGKAQIVYLFPKAAQNLAWTQGLIQNGKIVYFIDKEFFSKKIKLKNLYFIKELVHKHKVRIIHTHFIEYNYTLFIFKKLFGRQIQFLINFHNHYIPGGKLAFLKTWVIKKTNDVFIGDSGSVSANLIKCGFPSNKVVTILNSIDFTRLETFQPLSISKIKNGHVILIFGYPWHRKGVDVVVKAINELRKLKITLAIAQSGSVEQTKEAIANIFGKIPDWIVFLPPREDLATYYNSASIFISAGREEGLSYSPIEAAYCNCQLICSNIPGNPLDIPDMPIYPVENIQELANCIKTTLKMNEESLNTVKANQKLYVLKHYNIENWVKEIVQQYTL